MTALLPCAVWLFGSVLSAEPTQRPVDPDLIVEFAVRSWSKTPLMQIEDAYKWLFHATMGGEHAVRDEEGPRRWLDREWAGLAAPRASEPECVALDPDGRVLRVNLRPYMARGGDQEMLLWVFVESARRFRADKSQFLAAWRSLGKRLERRRVGGITAVAWQRLDARCAGMGYPAIEHSEEYIRAYAPAYRVVLGALWAN